MTGARKQEFDSTAAQSALIGVPLSVPSVGLQCRLIYRVGEKKVAVLVLPGWDVKKESAA